MAYHRPLRIISPRPETLPAVLPGSAVPSRHRQLCEPSAMAPSLFKSTDKICRLESSSLKDEKTVKARRQQTAGLLTYPGKSKRFETLSYGGVTSGTLTAPTSFFSASIACCSLVFCS